MHTQSLLRVFNFLHLWLHLWELYVFVACKKLSKRESVNQARKWFKVTLLFMGAFRSIVRLDLSMKTGYTRNLNSNHEIWRNFDGDILKYPNRAEMANNWPLILSKLSLIPKESWSEVRRTGVNIVIMRDWWDMERELRCIRQTLHIDCLGLSKDIWDKHFEKQREQAKCKTRQMWWASNGEDTYSWGITDKNDLENLAPDSGYVASWRHHFFGWHTNVSSLHYVQGSATY